MYRARGGTTVSATLHGTAMQFAVIMGCPEYHGKRAATLRVIRRPNGMGDKLHGQGLRVYKLRHGGCRQNAAAATGELQPT